MCSIRRCWTDQIWQIKDGVKWCYWLLWLWMSLVISPLMMVCVICFFTEIHSFTACQSECRQQTGSEGISKLFELKYSMASVLGCFGFIYSHSCGSNVSPSPFSCFQLQPCSGGFASAEFFPSAASVAQSQPPTTLRCSCRFYGFFFLFFRRLGGKIITHKDKYKSKTKPSNSDSGSSCLPWKEDKTGKKQTKRKKKLGRLIIYLFFFKFLFMPWCISGLRGRFTFSVAIKHGGSFMEKEGARSFNVSDQPVQADINWH